MGAVAGLLGGVGLLLIWMACTSEPPQWRSRRSRLLADILVQAGAGRTSPTMFVLGSLGLGLLIGHGCTVKSALNEMTMVAEGYFAADCIRHINFRHRVDMPIADMVYRVLYEGASARRCMQELTTKLI